MTGELTINPDKTITLVTEKEIIIYKFASFWRRLLARFIDSLIISIPSSFIPVIIPWLYWCLQQSGERQATVGQSAVGIMLLSLDGFKISFGQATGRFFADILNLATLFIGYLMFFFTKRKQCLHDYISGCIVVQEIYRKPRVEIIEQEMSNTNGLINK